MILIHVAMSPLLTDSSAQESHTYFSTAITMGCTISQWKITKIKKELPSHYGVNALNEWVIIVTIQNAMVTTHNVMATINNTVIITWKGFTHAFPIRQFFSWTKEDMCNLLRILILMS